MNGEPIHIQLTHPMVAQCNSGNNILGFFHYIPRIFVDIPVCTAQGGDGSFKDRKQTGEVGSVIDGWQSEPTDGPTSGWRQRSVVVVVVALVVVM